MRSIIDQKMRKNKTFMELKVLSQPEQAHHRIVRPPMNEATGAFKVIRKNVSPLPKIDSSPEVLKQAAFSSAGMGVRERILFQKLEPKEDRA